MKRTKKGLSGSAVDEFAASLVHAVWFVITGSSVLEYAGHSFRQWFMCSLLIVLLIELSKVIYETTPTRRWFLKAIRSRILSASKFALLVYLALSVFTVATNLLLTS